MRTQSDLILLLVPFFILESISLSQSTIMFISITKSCILLALMMAAAAMSAPMEHSRGKSISSSQGYNQNESRPTRNHEGASEAQVTSSTDPSFKYLTDVEKAKILTQERKLARKAKGQQIRQEAQLKDILMDCGEMLGKQYYFDKGNDYTDYNSKQ